MTELEFLEYIVDYGTHVQFKYGDDIIQKRTHLTPQNSNFNHFEFNIKGGKYNMSFEINGKKATAEECADLITRYKRNKTLEKVLDY